MGKLRLKSLQLASAKTWGPCWLSRHDNSQNKTMFTSTPPKTWITRILEKETSYEHVTTHNHFQLFIYMLTYIWRITTNQFKHMSMIRWCRVLAKMKITFVGCIITKSRVVDVITNFMLSTWNQQWLQQWLEKGTISTWRVQQVHETNHLRWEKYIIGNEKYVVCIMKSLFNKQKQKQKKWKERWRESLEANPRGVDLEDPIAHSSGALRLGPKKQKNIFGRDSLPVFAKFTSNFFNFSYKNTLDRN